MQLQADQLVRRDLYPDVARGLTQRDGVLLLVPRPHLARERSGAWHRRRCRATGGQGRGNENGNREKHREGLHGYPPWENVLRAGEKHLPSWAVCRTRLNEIQDECQALDDSW